MRLLFGGKERELKNEPRTPTFETITSMGSRIERGTSGRAKEPWRVLVLRIQERSARDRGGGATRGDYFEGAADAFLASGESGPPAGCTM